MVGPALRTTLRAPSLEARIAEQHLLAISARLALPYLSLVPSGPLPVASDVEGDGGSQTLPLQQPLVLRLAPSAALVAEAAADLIDHFGWTRPLVLYDDPLSERSLTSIGP